MLLQSVIAEINNQIGASGVLSQQCKAVAAQYGEIIIEKLIAKVHVPSLYQKKKRNCIVFIYT